MAWMGRDHKGISGRRGMAALAQAREGKRTLCTHAVAFKPAPDGHVRQAKALEPFASKAKSVKPPDPSVKSLIAALAGPLEKNPKWMLVINEPVEIDF